MKTFKGTIEDAVTIFKSGIITPLNKIDLRPEKLATDDNLYLSEKQKAERRKEWAKFQNNLLTQIDTVLQTSDLGDGAKLELLNFRNNIFDHHGPASVLKEAKSDKIIETLDAFAELTEKFSASGLDNIVELLSFAVNDSTKTGRPEDYYTANANKDIFPLWQRILNSTLGVDLKYFKEGAIKNGKQAVDLFEQQGQRDIIKNTMKAMLSTRSAAEVSKYITYRTPKESLYTGNNSRDGSFTVDWKKTAENMKAASFSLKATADDSRAYSDSLKSQLDTVNSAFADMLTITESAENIYDPQFRKELGEYFGKLEANGINAFDLRLLETSDNIEQFKENAVKALNDMKENLMTLSATASAITSFKDSLKSATDEINNLKLQELINTGAIVPEFMKGMKYSDITSIFSDIQQTLQNPENKAAMNGYTVEQIMQKVFDKYAPYANNSASFTEEMSKQEEEKKSQKEAAEKAYETGLNAYNEKLRLESNERSAYQAWANSVNDISELLKERDQVTNDQDSYNNAKNLLSTLPSEAGAYTFNKLNEIVSQYNGRDFDKELKSLNDRIVQKRQKERIIIRIILI